MNQFYIFNCFFLLSYFSFYINSISQEWIKPCSLLLFHSSTHSIHTCTSMMHPPNRGVVLTFCRLMTCSVDIVLFGPIVRVNYHCFIKVETAFIIVACCFCLLLLARRIVYLVQINCIYTSIYECCCTLIIPFFFDTKVVYV